VFRYLKAAQPLDSHAPSWLNEETSRTLTFEEVRNAFACAFRGDLGARDSELLPVEQQNADRLLREKYDTDEWNLVC
jgi:lipoate-protein ligase A